MIRVIVVGFALIVSACNAHALRQIMVTTPGQTLNHSRLQFECTENGLLVFEGFPDIVRTNLAIVNDPGIPAEADKVTKRSAGPSSKCLAQLD